jgi:hypothetical protein
MKIETDAIIRQLKMLEKKKREQKEDRFADGVQQSINEINMIIQDKKGVENK